MAGGKTKRRGQFEMEVDESGQDVESTAAPADAAPAEGDEEEEADFPEINLEELLEDFDEMTLNDKEE
ncbi:hypothetical protein NLI96_g9152 [Meripilus lineatus]|uniref:Uncharacterized protein n=1 Tax=Meripilus lineatus TaxID=2056292 RepID=A0AAD5UY97_9APHY|nr:hypothetical protein NLI96_g9152 [Physisporinus lineatus]